MSMVMCRCKNCSRNTLGVKTGLSGGGHLVGIVLTLLTGLLALPLYILMMLCSGSVRCSICGNKATKL